MNAGSPLVGESGATVGSGVPATLCEASENALIQARRVPAGYGHRDKASSLITFPDLYLAGPCSPRYLMPSN